MEKKSYMLGTKDPKDKPKPDKRLVVYPGRFKYPMFSNFDLYETPEGDRGSGPGVGLSGSRKKYKSVKEFIDDKRKRNKNKYVAPPDEFYADDKKVKKSLKSAHEKISLFLTKVAQLDSLYDSYYHGDPIDYLRQNSVESVSQSIGGIYDRLTPNRSVLDAFSPSGESVKWIMDTDENYAKSKKIKVKRKVKKINRLLDRMVGRSFSGYPYGYGGYGRANYYDNRDYNDNDGGSGDYGGGDAGGDGGGGGGDGGGGDGGGGE